MTDFSSGPIQTSPNPKEEFILSGKIMTIRHQCVMIDKDLALLYGVETKVLNQAVKRNIKRFPEQFCWQLTQDEFLEPVTTCDRFKVLKHSGSRPYAFTEQGVAMLSAVLKSPTAIQVSIEIMNAFVQMRKLISGLPGLQFRVESIENKQIETQHQINRIFELLDHRQLPLHSGIFFEGQFYDAHQFISDLIGSAGESIMLVDNYVDVKTIRRFVAKKSNVDVTIFTKSLSEATRKEIRLFNQQYPDIHCRRFPLSHDRFLIIDNQKLYHIGASLKDLGNKWFAFSRLDSMLSTMMNRLKDYMEEKFDDQEF